ncbi:MAG: hypothetical protein U0930_16335 [Pirellulales bacterium]
MTNLDEDLFDDLFHGCAFAAFLDEAALTKTPPCSERTRRRAYQYFEQALAEKHAKQPGKSVPSPI